MEPTDLPDLAADRLGGAAIACNDEFFAPKENLTRSAAPVFDPDRYTDRGKWMDGWETRRRREPGHDWVVVRLGVPGVVHAVDVDTAHFRGNFPEAAAVDGCYLDEEAHPAALTADEGTWVPLVERAPLGGDAHNLREVAEPALVSHVRLRIFPDGGVARLRVHGEPLPDWRGILAAGGPVDLAGVAHGGRAVDASDRFFSPPGNLLLPGAPHGMHDGWETRRRRGPGHDWVVVRLGVAGAVEAVEVDTTHFKGNAPGWCSLDGLLEHGGDGGDAGARRLSPQEEPPGDDAWDVPPGDGFWEELLPRTALEPHRPHRFEVRSEGPVSHVRLNIYPDGGVARLRVLGVPDPAALAAVGVRRLDLLPAPAAAAALRSCCGSSAWVAAMVAVRPFGDREGLQAAAARVWAGLGRDDRLEALASHPRIGEREGGDQPATGRGWSEREQAGTAGASAATREGLVEGNRAYEERFGHPFVVFATGKTAEEMLAILEERLGNEPGHELEVAAAEQAKITALRLDKLLGLTD